MTDPNDATLASYETGAEQYVIASARPSPALVAFLDRLAGMVGTGHVLEVGSGPGWDADYLESRGVRVTRTDGASAFVALLQAAGHDARRLDVRSASLGGPYHAILADAVLLHLSRHQFEDFVRRARRAVTADGVLGFTLKEGDGGGWSHEKLAMPRYFTYWREPAVRDVLARADWPLVSVDHVAGRKESWLYVLAGAAGPART